MPVERRERVIAFEIGSTGNGRNPAARCGLSLARQPTLRRSHRQAALMCHSGRLSALSCSHRSISSADRFLIWSTRAFAVGLKFIANDGFTVGHAARIVSKATEELSVLETLRD